MSLRVDTHISGSHCVVWKTSQHYLDCRKGKTRAGTPVTNIEAVCRGHVYLRKQVLDAEAPEQIIQMIREELT